MLKKLFAYVQVMVSSTVWSRRVGEWESGRVSHTTSHFCGREELDQRGEIG